MEPEIFFLKYAFPCSFIIRQRAEINENQLDKLEKAAVNNRILPRPMLEKIYFRAFEKIEPIAAEMKKDKWDTGVLKEYFLKRHNDVIEKGMYAYAKAPETLKNLCKVQKATVLRTEGNVMVVKYKDKTRPVIRSLVPDAKKGDNVTIHYGYAVEKL